MATSRALMRVGVSRPWKLGSIRLSQTDSLSCKAVTVSFHQKHCSTVRNHGNKRITRIDSAYTLEQPTIRDTGSASYRLYHSTSATGLLEDIQSCTDHTSLLMIVGQNRARLNEEHVSEALVQLWEVMKFIENRNFKLRTEVQVDQDFLSLCVLAENKVDLMSDEAVSNALYAAIKLLCPNKTHSLIRELRNRALSRLDQMNCQQLSKVAVCLSDMQEWRTSALGAVTHAFGQKLDSVSDIRELSAWMRECLPLASNSLCSRVFAKAHQFLDGARAEDVGNNDVRRVVQTLAKVHEPSTPVIERCGCLFLQKMENDFLSVRDVCLLYNYLSSLGYRGENIQSRVADYLQKMLPATKDATDASLMIDILAVKADADLKFQLEDKAVQVIDQMPLSSLHHLCHGLRTMNYQSETPLVKKIVKQILDNDCTSLSTGAISRIVEYLTRVESVDKNVYVHIYSSLISMLYEAFNLGRIMHIIYCISLMPLKAVDNLVFKRATAILPQLHTAGINQMLLAVARISRRMSQHGPLPNQCASLLQSLQDLAVNSINQITSVCYLNNIVDFLLEEGDQSFLTGVAFQRYTHILSRLTPQLAIECARHLLHARYLQPALLDEIAKVIAQDVRKITPLQVLYAIGPFSSLSHQPPNASEFYEACVGRILPFLDSLPAGYIVDVAHLCTLGQQYPEELLRKIFSLEFLTRLDEELEALPNRSMMYRRKLMYLNRSVALECPELQVPWFHEDFCRDILKSRKVYFHPSLQEIQETLVAVLGGSQFLRSFVITPYHYDVSFECVLDSEGSPLPCADYGSVLNRLGAVAGGVLADLMQWGTQTKQLPEAAQRVAIDYMFSNSYCVNSRHALGMAALKKRHLELMGYKYVQIPFYEWHSIDLAEREDRVEYLQQLIFSPSFSSSNTIANTQMSPRKEKTILPTQWRPQGGAVLAMATQDSFGRMSDPDMVEDPLVMKVLQTMDRIA